MKKHYHLTNQRVALWSFAMILGAAFFIFAAPSRGAGLLKPLNPSAVELTIRDHQVSISVINGFARTEVTQSFHNPNPNPLEAIYELPLPEEASLSEMTIWAGEQVLQGEVVDKAVADQIYEDEKAKGNSAGKAQKLGIQRFEFYVYPVPPNGETRIRTVYYQPLEIDTGIARYVYPIEEGGTDEMAESFWLLNDKVEGNFSIKAEVRSAWPVIDMRTPNYSGQAQQIDEGHYRYEYQSQGGTLDKDFVLYYRLADNLPGRLEVIPYKPSADKPGTFMAILTPGLDLKPLTQGSDYVFILDTSGSMKGKLQTLVNGMRQTIGKLRPEDRYRIVTFNNTASELTRGKVSATQTNVDQTFKELDALVADGGTNLYDGLRMGLDSMDDDRATSVIIVTDGVTNTGVVDPKHFYTLMAQNDARVFGFLLGNSANWPLMKVICESTGGFYTGISNSDDILGKLLQAKEKVAYEALLNAELKLSGVKTWDVTGSVPKKVFRGEQLVLFGRYEQAGKLRLSLDATLTEEDKTYSTEFDLPEIDRDNPELERLWATAKIEEIQLEENMGKLAIAESKQAIKDIGIAYQLVTDETSMLVLSDEAFARHNIQRNNQQRVASELSAQSARANAPVKNYRVDQAKPMFNNQPAPRFGGGGGGGGALGPIEMALLVMPLLSWFVFRKPRHAK